MNDFFIKQISGSETWLLRQTVMYPNYSLEHVKLEKDAQGIHFGGFIGDKMVSVVSIFIENNEIQFRKLATLELYQGRGYGTKMLQHVISFSKQKKSIKLWCNARLNKTKFYHKFGLKETDKTYVAYGIDFVVMEYNFKTT